ncbi:MAG: hypothetical protein JRN02_04940 [Nitrososphaerota archaeon]|nr:hypothetical protein [Nitrososphaerota archaeon]MDG7048890.1 hypothetical protein [Nitrososphaerota archaeon]
MANGRTLMAELPIPESVRSAERMLGFLRKNREAFDAFLITDLPFGSPSLDGLALLKPITEIVDPSRLVLTVSTGHRDMSANLSRVYGGIYMGIGSFLLVQGTGKVTKALDIMERLRGENIRLGVPVSDLSERGIGLTRRKIELRASFVVCQMYPDVRRVYEAVGSTGAEVFLTYPIFSNASTLAKFRERGMSVPPGLSEGQSSLEERTVEMAARGVREYERISGGHRRPSAYIIPLARDFDYSVLRKGI